MLIINTQTQEVSWTEFPQNDHLLSPSQQMAKTPYLFIEQLHNAADKHGKDAKSNLTPDHIAGVSKNQRRRVIQLSLF